MANFDPPQNHWAADFDARLISTLTFLKDELEKAQREIADLKRKTAAQDKTIAQGIADARAYAKGN